MTEFHYLSNFKLAIKFDDCHALPAPTFQMFLNIFLQTWDWKSLYPWPQMWKFWKAVAYHFLPWNLWALRGLVHCQCPGTLSRQCESRAYICKLCSFGASCHVALKCERTHPISRCVSQASLMRTPDSYWQKTPCGSNGLNVIRGFTSFVTDKKNIFLSQSNDLFVPNVCNK